MNPTLYRQMDFNLHIHEEKKTTKSQAGICTIEQTIVLKKKQLMNLFLTDMTAFQSVSKKVCLLAAWCEGNFLKGHRKGPFPHKPALTCQK